ncbi:MAG: methyltransferase domain-containing protein [Actinomycetes bacterium]
MPLPITVLAWEGPQARAYLERMRAAGLRPARVVLIVRPRGSLRGRPGPGRHPLFLRRAQRLQDASHNHHPYAIKRRNPALVAAIAEAMTGITRDPAATFDAMFSGFSYEDHADEFVRVVADSYKDPRLGTALADLGVTDVLFTGGGIVPPSIFAIDGIRLFHVHTGLLPYVRGADVLLWSLLTRGRPAVSAFVMTPGLDDGDVLAVKELPPLAVSLPPGPRPDDDTLYRAMFSFIDPLIRAELLVEDVLVPAAGDLGSMVTMPQDLGVGITYHFMHPTLRARALRMLYTQAEVHGYSAMTGTDDVANVGASANPRVGSPAGYQRFYDELSARAPLTFERDARRAESNVRATSIRNRRQDYARLAGDPALASLHAAMNRQLAMQDEQWDSYDYGEGWFYQSSGRLGISGLRDTDGRIVALDLAELVRGRRLLEIGCNSGFLTLELARTAAHITAIELNPHLVEIARLAADYCGVTNVAYSVSAFEEFEAAAVFEDVVSFANHSTYDGNTQQSLEDYFARCHRYTAPGGRLIFESHPPELEGDGFPRTLAIIERFYDVEQSFVPDYGTALDKRRRVIVGRRREAVGPAGQ